MCLPFSELQKLIHIVRKARGNPGLIFLPHEKGEPAMGGMIKAPKAPSMPIIAPYQQPESGVDETALRVEALDRRRRGLSGTVQTSDRGLVSLNASAPQKKTLLGE